VANPDDARASTSRRLRIGGALTFLVWTAGDSPALAITVEEFARSPAAAAYTAGRYEAALAEIETMLRREPRDPILLRVRGMALYRLDRFEAAEAALIAAVAANPADPAAHYWLGAARYKRGNLRGALVEFTMVESIAPNTRYSASAREFKSTIEAQAAGPATTAAPERPWSVAIATGSQYDDNVALVNRDRIKSFRFFGEAAGAYVFPLGDGFALTFDGRIHGSSHFKAAADDFNLLLFSGGATLAWRTAIGPYPARLLLGYNYEYVMQGGIFYNDGHAISPRIEIGLLPDSVTTAGFTLGFDSFALAAGFNPAVFSRDGMRYAAGARHVQYLPGRQHYFWGAYEFTLYETDGANFDAYAHAGSAGASFGLPWGIRLDFAAELGYTRYFNYVDSPKRRALKQIYTAWLTKALTPNLSLSFAYAYTFDDSNIRDLETRRNLFTVSARYTF
jgi:tetratricopeptide (TPR) repeat protein